MSDKDLLWVSVTKNTVSIKSGAGMPAPESGYSWAIFGDASVSRKEFARWSGLTFPKGEGIYAVRVKLGVIRRYRKVSSEEFVAAKHRTSRLEELK